MQIKHGGLKVLHMGHEIDPRTLTKDAAIDIITQLVISQGWLGIAVEYAGPGYNWHVSIKEPN